MLGNAIQEATDLTYMIQILFDILMTKYFTYAGATFSLWDVAVAGGIFSVSGFFIGKIFFVALDRKV